jgi:hypothetical protein
LRRRSAQASTKDPDLGGDTSTSSDDNVEDETFPGQYELRRHREAGSDSDEAEDEEDDEEDVDAMDEDDDDQGRLKTGRTDTTNQRGGSEWEPIKILLEGDGNSYKMNTASNTCLRLTTKVGQAHVATGVPLDLGTNKHTLPTRERSRTPNLESSDPHRSDR